MWYVGMTKTRDDSEARTQDYQPPMLSFPIPKSVHVIVLLPSFLPVLQYLKMSASSTNLDPSAQKVVDVATATIKSMPSSATFAVASAALASDGQIYTGVNILHFTGGPCAEIVAFGNAAAHGAAEKLTHIVAVGDKGRGVIPPCGRCRQMLIDLSPGISVVTWDEHQETVEVGKKKLRVASIVELLPGAYRITNKAQTIVGISE